MGTVEREVNRACKTKSTPPRLPLCGVETLASEITVRDVCEYTHLTPAQVRRRCKKGEISAVKRSGRWLIDRDDALKDCL